MPDGKPPGVDFEGLLKTLLGSGVEFIVVGGAAAAAAGSTRLTLDLDVVYARTSANLTALAMALRPLSPYLRGAPPGLPFRWDEATLRRGLNFTLTTSLGDLDLLGEITGGGGFEALLPHSVELTLFGDSLPLPRARQDDRRSSAPPDGPKTWKPSPSSRRSARNGASSGADRAASVLA